MAEILGITDDSRKVKPGWAFVAVKGLTVDGHDFVDEAIKNGADRVYGEKDIKNSKYLKVADSRQKLGELASEFYGNPSSKIKIIGVTGTDGKTTTASLVYHILKANAKKVGLISTVSAKIGSTEYDTGFHVTNPDPVMLNKFLAEMVESGMEYAVLEVTSHGIDQKRIAGIKFDICVVTNITKEHLDYHKTYENYRNVKLSFLKMSREVSIINKDDTSYDYLSKNLVGKCEYYERLKDLKGILPGIYNESNAAAAVKVAEILGIKREFAIESIGSFSFPEGRLEEIKNNLGFKIYVDFAHTPNALENVLTFLKKETKGKLISVFGCASERDIKKRPAMAKISSQIADVSIFTVEDSRFEDIYKIFKPMVGAARRLGKKKDQDFFEIPERGEAITFALSKAKPGDSVVICGKGHEKSLAYKGYEHPWSDQIAVRNYLNKNDDVSAIIMAAGKGSRMKSYTPKVLREICGRPVLSYALENLRKSWINDVILVVSYRKNLIMHRYPLSVKYAIQNNSKGGTGDAVRVGLEKIYSTSKYILALYGDDSAFFKTETTRKVIEEHISKKATVSFVSMPTNDPYGLGRVIRNVVGEVIGIVEEKEATDEQKKIKEVNCGHFIFNRVWLEKNIKNIRTSTSGEIYVVDLIKTAFMQNQKVNVYRLNNDDEWQGINTPEQLELANKKMEVRLNKE